MLKHAAGRSFYNTSKHSFTTLLADPDNVAGNLRNYIAGFSPSARLWMAPHDLRHAALTHLWALIGVSEVESGVATSPLPVVGLSGSEVVAIQETMHVADSRPNRDDSREGLVELVGRVRSDRACCPG